MKHQMLTGFFLFFIGCHEPCKNGYGRAADNLCYPLADDPVAPCGDGYARDDEGDCVAVDGESSVSATGDGGSGTDAGGTSGSGASDASGSTGGSETGTTGSADGGESGAASTGGEATGSAAGGGSTGGGDGFGSATIKGVLNTSDSSGFSEGDNVLIQAWTGDMIDPESGWPLDAVLDDPRASQVAGAAVTAVSIHFEFIMSDVPESGEEIRLTGHLTEDPLEWEGSPRGAYPSDPGEWILVTPGTSVEDVILVIYTGEPTGDETIPPGGDPPGGDPPGGDPPGGDPPGGDPPGGDPPGGDPTDTGSPGDDL